MKREKIFEQFLWNSRFIVLVAVVASLLVGLAMFLVATVDVIHLFKDIVAYMGHSTGEKETGNVMAAYIGHSSGDEEARSVIVASVVEIIDGYLLATMMLVFSFGLYELFISRINAAEGNELASRVLLIQNMDDLKDRLSKLVLLILVVKFFQHAVKQTSTQGSTGALDLLYFSVGIFLIGAALYVSHKKSPTHNNKPGEKSDTEKDLG